MSCLSSCQSKLTGFKFCHNIYQKFKCLVIKAVLALLRHMQRDKAVLMSPLLLPISLQLVGHQGLLCRVSCSLLNSECETEVKHNKYFMVWVYTCSSKLFQWAVQSFCAKFSVPSRTPDILPFFRIYF